MKKIIIVMFLLLTHMIFSKEKDKNKYSCDYINPRDSIMTEIIDKIKTEKNENDFFCDVDNLKTMYYLIGDGKYELNLGIKLEIAEETTYGQLRENFENKLMKYIQFTTDIKENGKNKEYLKNISKINVRFYGINEKNQILLYLGRYVQNMDNDAIKFIAYGKNEKRLEEIGIFRNIKVDYSKDEEIIF